MPSASAIFVFCHLEFLRDACLVDRNFYDDYFRQSEVTKRKKSRPFMFFTDSSNNNLIIVPFRNGTNKETRFAQEWRVPVSKSSKTDNSGKLKEQQADLSHMFVVQMSDFKMVVKGKTTNEFEEAALENIQRMVNEKFSKKEYDRAPKTVLDPYKLVGKVNHYRNCLHVLMPKMSKLQSKLGSQSARALKEYESLLDTFDSEYTRLATFNMESKTLHDGRGKQIERCTIDSVRQCTQYLTKLADLWQSSGEGETLESEMSRFLSRLETARSWIRDIGEFLKS